MLNTSRIWLFNQRTRSDYIKPGQADRSKGILSIFIDFYMIFIKNKSVFIYGDWVGIRRNWPRIYYMDRGSIFIDRKSIYGSWVNIFIDRKSIYGSSVSPFLEKKSIYGSSVNPLLKKKSIYGPSVLIFPC